MYSIPALLWFLAIVSRIHSATIVQSPQSVVEELGRQISLECSLEGTSNPYIYWYRQLPGGQIYMLAYSVSIGQVDNTGPSHFSTSRTTDKEFLLSINGLLANDTGVYYCAWSLRDNSERQYFGDGTKLTVLEDVSKITDPKVAIFPPSKQEIKEKRKATLVCLVTGFYPDHIKLVWWVNGVERKEGVRTDESLMDKNKEKYSLTSRLRLSLQEWSNPKNVFHCHVEFYGNKNKTYDEVISGVADCSVSEESYLRSAMAGKSVYVLLIFKSALYGVFVMGLMLRNKQVQ